MASDSYLAVGRTGLRVSPLCLGAMTFGTLEMGGVDEGHHHAAMVAGHAYGQAARIGYGEDSGSRGGAVLDT